MSPAPAIPVPARLSLLRCPAIWLIALTLFAFVLRMVQLDTPVLRWDEGWSLAHASLPWSALVRVAAEDWHPPLYTILLKLWLISGKTTFGIRYLSVLLSTLAVPLTYRVALAWAGRRRLALLAALGAAWLPMLVYYGQVTRMYPLAALTMLAATAALLRGLARPSWRADATLALSTTAAMLTLYQAVWPLIGLYLYGALAQPRRLPRLLLCGLGAVVGYVPWLLIAGPTIRARMGADAADGEQVLRGVLHYLRPTAVGLTFSYDSGWPAIAALLLVLALGLLFWLLRRPRPAAARRLLLPALVILVSLFGIAYVSQSSRWFAVRHLVPATLFLALGLAWALDSLAVRWKPLLPLALAVLALAYWPTSSRFVYAKTLEVVDPFDPAADYCFIRQNVRPADLVYFNVLSTAGWYENLRGPEDPRWSYAMRWEPIIEPLPRIADRVARDAAVHRRLWFAIYRGTYATNAPLKAWLDAHYYPAGGSWQGDTLFLAYAVAGEDWTTMPRQDVFGPLLLRAVRFTPQAVPGGEVAVELTWAVTGVVPANYKVFVHLTDETGWVVAQHDDLPLGGDELTAGWRVGRVVLDRHGVLLPETLPDRLHLRIGLYDAATGERVRLPDGREWVEIATLDVVR